jgi:hypothetical protein
VGSTFFVCLFVVKCKDPSPQNTFRGHEAYGECHQLLVGMKSIISETLRVAALDAAAVVFKNRAIDQDLYQSIHHDTINIYSD